MKIAKDYRKTVQNRLNAGAKYSKHHYFEKKGDFQKNLKMSEQ